MSAHARAGRDVVVIGGGVAGLATAALLGQAGERVTVVEKNRAGGGRMDELEVAGFRFETGPSWYLMPEVFEWFFGHFGLSTDELYGLRRLDPAYRVVGKNRDVVDVETGRADALFERLDPGSGARLAGYLRSAAQAYRTAEQKFLFTTFSRPRDLCSWEVACQLPRLARLLIEPLRAKARRVTRHPVLRQILEYPAVFLSSRPDQIPSLYHLMSHADLSAGVFYPEGGFSAITRALERVCADAGVELRYGCRATRIVTRGHGRDRRATGVCVEPSGGDGHGAGETLACDAVVSCADLHHTETQLLGEEERSRSRRWWASRDPGLSAVVVLLGVRGAVAGLAHHTLFFEPDWDRDFDTVFGGPKSIAAPRAAPAELARLGFDLRVRGEQDQPRGCPGRLREPFRARTRPGRPRDRVRRRLR